MSTRNIASPKPTGLPAIALVGRFLAEPANLTMLLVALAAMAFMLPSVSDALFLLAVALTGWAFSVEQASPLQSPNRAPREDGAFVPERTGSSRGLPLTDSILED